MKRALLALAPALLWCAPALADAYDPAPWLEDLAQTRRALDEKYANLDWLEQEREVDLDRLFGAAAERIRKARDESGAKAVFDRLVQRIGDGHVALHWPAPSAPAAPAPAGPKPALCPSLGYDARQSSPGVAPALSGYRALADGENAFPAGTTTVGADRVGVLRIGVFQPQGYPALCEAAAKALAIPQDKPCDAACEDAILTWAYRRMTSDFEGRLRQLKMAGATVLLVDITDNGGGSEWAEAAARMVSGKPLTSERIGFVRGPHWVKHWNEIAATLRQAAREAEPAARARLLAWAAEADAARREAAPCAGCDRIGRAGFATGLMGAAPAGAFAGKNWAPYVFSIGQFDYHDGVWSGPLIVLTDQETWSAAEEFAAILQDNEAAIIMGARTGGAGCGHTNGGTPTVLAHSGATLEVPDCIRFRKDGSNEVRGILPDALVALRANDGPRFKAGLIEVGLPKAIEQAKALYSK